MFPASSDYNQHQERVLVRQSEITNYTEYLQEMMLSHESVEMSNWIRFLKMYFKNIWAHFDSWQLNYANHVHEFNEIMTCGKSQLVISHSLLSTLICKMLLNYNDGKQSRAMMFKFILFLYTLTIQAPYFSSKLKFLIYIAMKHIIILFVH